jgi:hypothetical protein
VIKKKNRKFLTVSLKSKLKIMGRKENKLECVAQYIVQLLKEKTGEKPDFELEYFPDWFASIQKDRIERKYWQLICDVYKSIMDKKYQLEDFIVIKSKQKYDIWIGSPFNFAVEFDEKQHFNQFRKRTLSFYEQIPTGFSMDMYKELNTKIVNPGISGFQKLGSKDSLFPEMLEGDKQDNRIRQRVFRDYLKDILPIAYGYNHTIRIPYTVTGKKTKDFCEEDLKKISKYINEYGLMNGIINLKK